MAQIITDKEGDKSFPDSPCDKNFVVELSEKVPKGWCDFRC